MIGIQRSDKALGFTWGPVGFGDLQASEPLISLRKPSRKQRRPHPLTRFVRDEVLATFECHMMQVPLLAMAGIVNPARR